MSDSKSEALTEEFYAWEQRGRGWCVFSEAVDPEPSFHPFFGHLLFPEPVEDDSLKHTLFTKVKSLFKAKEEVQLSYKMPPVQAQEFECDEELVVYRVRLPKEHKLRLEDMGHLLVMLTDTNFPISFEITATHTEFHFQFAIRRPDAGQLLGQVKSFFPGIRLEEFPHGLDLLAENSQTCIVDFGITDEFMIPILTADQAEKEPFIGLLGVLESLSDGEYAAIQILFKGAVNPWAKSILAAVTDNKGESFFRDFPDMPIYAKEKIASPLYGVCVRIAAQAKDAKRATGLAGHVSNAVARITNSGANRLQALSQKGYPQDEMIADMFLRQSHRVGMLLNSGELATLVHFPTPEILSSKLTRDTRKTKAAPQDTRGQKFVLGLNAHQGTENLVSIPTSLRLRHTHVIGATGTGKSTLLLSMIAEDILHGNGFAVLDPHGDLIESILPYIPRERVNDVILVDPADVEYPVAFNILSAHSEIEKDILSSDLVAAFKRLSTSWGDQMNSVLANAILAFLESKEGGTLLDLRRFLVEPAFRDTYLKTVSDPQIAYYWRHEYPLLKSNSIGSILTRLDTFLRPKLIRNMVAQKQGIDFEHILDNRKILLVKLSQGLIGAENSFLLGTFFVSKIYQAAMARQAAAQADRNDFFLYIDEFQNFITPSMSHILSGARKYHLGLILAHQDMQQLQKYDTELASSVVVNAGTRICFRLGDTDAKRFASGFSSFDAEDLENLETGEAIARIEQPNHDFNLKTIRVREIDAAEAQVTTSLIVAASREKYGTKREDIEAHLGNSITVPAQEIKETVSDNPSETEKPNESAPFVSTEIPVQPEAIKRAEQTQHRYLQTFIKRAAEQRGYKAVIELQTPDGKGRVDVSLEKGSQRIACEISVTTSGEWEVHNIEKCIAAGYNEVIVCSSDTKTLQRIRTQMESKLNKAQLNRVLTLGPDAVIQYLDKQVINEGKTEKVVKGYRVKVEFDPPDKK